MQPTITGQNNIIDNIKDLENLVKWSNLLASPEKIELNLPGLTPDEKRQYQSLISNYTAVCGCEEGKILLVTLVAGYIIYLYSRTGGFTGAGWTEFAIGFSMACLGAVMGKAYGLIRARLKLRTIVADLCLRVHQ